jgi:hypothetical protein
MFPLRSWSFVLLAAAGVLAGCKGKTVVKADPEVVNRLKDCADKTKAKDDLIATYEADLAKYKLGSSPGGNELVMRIDGDTLAITARPAGAGIPAVDDKVAIELGNQFVDNVRKSRGSIQKCYEQALKKNTAIQARTITLQVSAKFSAAGAVSRSDFRPDLGPAFDACMQGVATRWKLTAQAQGMSFQTTVTLSPS